MSINTLSCIGRIIFDEFRIIERFWLSFRRASNESTQKITESPQKVLAEEREKEPEKSIENEPVRSLQQKSEPKRDPKIKMSVIIIYLRLVSNVWHDRDDAAV